MRRGLLFAALIFLGADHLHSSDSEFIEMIRTSQDRLAEANPAAAEAPLVEWEKKHPEAWENLTYCYQRFFVALEGRGDRITAREMLDQLNRLVEAGAVPADSAEFLSVTEAWYEALLATDSDLIRRANQIMTDRLSQNSK